MATVAVMERKMFKAEKNSFVPPGDALSLFSNVRHCSWVVRKLRPCFKVCLELNKLAASRKQALACSFVSEMMILFVADNTPTSTFKGPVFIA